MEQPFLRQDFVTDSELALQAQQALTTLAVADQVLERRRFDYAYPYFVVFGLAILLTYPTGQYLSSDITWLTTGVVWVILFPLCSFVAGRWHRWEEQVDGLVRKPLKAVRGMWFYRGILGAVGIAFTILLMGLELSQYIFSVWVILVATVYTIWGRQLERRLLVLGLLNLGLSAIVVLWLIDYQYIIFGLGMGGGNLVLGLMAWQRLKQQRRTRPGQTNGKATWQRD